jgi:hypothetical protein
LEINLLEYVNPAPPVNGDAYDLILPSIMLFEYDNPLNLTNNSKALELPGKGTLHVDASGKVTFIREPGFISGSIEAEYRISNKRMGDPVTYPSPRTRISIRLIHLPVPEITIVGPEGMGADLCLGESYHLQNALPGGEWSVSDPALASVDESGQLHPLAVGTLTVYYTITEENCSKTVSLELIIHDCEDDESKLLITNPMIRSRILKMNQP